MFSSCGADEKLGPVLKGRKVHRVSEFEVNPKVEDVARLLKELDARSCFDLILAVGGGSVIDTAKLIKAYWNSDSSITANLSGEEPLAPCDIPLIAMPTTAGSGSEATHFAVIYEGTTKYSVAHKRLLPDVAIVIPSLLQSVPKHIAASSGMDVLSQGIESYWSIYSTEESRAMASEAIGLAWNAISDATSTKSPLSLEQIARAAHLAGCAINLTKTTAPHAVSYALTSFYGVLHGHAVGLMIPAFLKYNACVGADDCLDSRGPKWVSDRVDEIVSMLGCVDVDEAAQAIVTLMQHLGLETSFPSLGIKDESDIETVVDNGFNPQRVNNNPRLVTEEALTKILDQMVAAS